MNRSTTLQNISHYFLVKIMIGTAVVVGSVVLIESTGRLLPELVKALLDVTVALISYVLLFRLYEKRPIKELSVSTLLKNAAIGFAAGFFLQLLFVFIIYLTGGYTITRVNPVSFLLPSFLAALRAGFVAEIIILGIFFRLTEEKLGTFLALIIFALLFAILHLGSKGATWLSVLCTATQAGVMLAAVYVYSRSLWLPIFLHFAWDFAEPGIFGGINPGNSIDESLFSSVITGSTLLTGGQSGPQNSIQALLICGITSVILLWLAKRKNNFVKRYWY